MADNLEQQVLDYVAKKISLSEQDRATLNKLGRNASMVSDLKTDSLDIMDVIMGWEEIYGIKVKDEDAQKWKNLGDAIDYIRTQPEYDSKKDYSNAIRKDLGARA